VVLVELPEAVLSSPNNIVLYYLLAVVEVVVVKLPEAVLSLRKGYEGDWVGCPRSVLEMEGNLDLVRGLFDPYREGVGECDDIRQ
jgi:hypothetical protein